MLSPQKKNLWILLTFLAVVLTVFRLVNANNTYTTCYSYSTFEDSESEFRKSTCKKKHVRKHPHHAREQLRLKKDRRRKRCKSATYSY